MIEYDLEADNETYKVILNGLKLNNTKIETVKSFLCNLKEVVKENVVYFDLATFNAIFDVCMKHKLIKEMEDFHHEMKKKDIKDNNYTCTILINAYT